MTLDNAVNMRSCCGESRSSPIGPGDAAGGRPQAKGGQHTPSGDVGVHHPSRNPIYQAEPAKAVWAHPVNVMLTSRLCRVVQLFNSDAGHGAQVLDDVRVFLSVSSDLHLICPEPSIVVATMTQVQARASIRWRTQALGIG